MVGVTGVARSKTEGTLVTLLVAALAALLVALLVDLLIVVFVVSWIPVVDFVVVRVKLVLVALVVLVTLASLFFSNVELLDTIVETEKWTDRSDKKGWQENTTSKTRSAEWPIAVGL